MRRRRQFERHGRGEEARLGRERLDGDAEVGQAGLARSGIRAGVQARAFAGGGRKARREPGPRRLEQLDDAFRGGREGRRKDDPQVVGPGGERQDLVVRDGHDPVLVGDDDRVALRRVELDPEERLDVLERIAARSLDLREIPERQRVLQAARCRTRPEKAPLEEIAQVGE